MFFFDFLVLLYTYFDSILFEFPHSFIQSRFDLEHFKFIFILHSFPLIVIVVESLT